MKTLTIIIKKSSGNYWYKNLIGKQLTATIDYGSFLVHTDNNNIDMDKIPVMGFISGIVEMKDAEVKNVKMN